MERSGSSLRNGDGTKVARIRHAGGVGAALVGVSWVGWIVLYAAVLFYGFMGHFELRLLWAVFILPMIGWVFTAFASALLVPLGYFVASRGVSPKKTAVAAVALYCLGAALLSHFGGEFFSFDPRVESFLLTGAVLIAGGSLFVISGAKGFKAAGCVVGMLGVTFFYFGGYVFPPACFEYLEYVLLYPNLIMLHPAFSTDILSPISAGSALLSLAVLVMLGSLATRWHSPNGRLPLAKLADSILTLSALAFGMVLAVLSLIAIGQLLPLLVSILARPDLVMGTGAVGTTVGLVSAGFLFSLVQVAGGILLALGGALGFAYLMRAVGVETSGNP